MLGSGVLELHRSNKMERLVERLSVLLHSDPLPPAEAEWIVVPGASMQRWLSIELAKRCGIAGNLRFPFPHFLINQALDSVLGGVPQGEEATPGAMYWAIVAQLEVRSNDAEFAPIRNYLRTSDTGSEDLRKRFQLAEKITHLFERYIVYRPELLRRWEKGDGDGWQPALWRSLGSRFLKSHPGARLSAYLSEVSTASGPLEALPPRLCLFGISALPPLYIRMISAMATRIEIHAFVLSPSRQYWADTWRNNSDTDETSEDSKLDGNPLLSSLGRLAGDFQQVLEENSEYNESGEDLYSEPGGNTMLSVLQSDILDLRHRAQDPPRMLVSPEDKSISLHSCHSVMREMEVLHDQLVALFENDSSLDAREVVVMAPDIELYAPAIEAVFLSSQEDRPTIEYSIADRSVGSSSLVIRAYSQLLKMLRGRMSASSVLDLLEHECIRQRFGILEEDLGTLASWVEKSGIRWGASASHRAEVQQPALQENTWRFGLDRLLLGYALPSGDANTFEGVSGFRDMEGTETALLGAFASFCSVLFHAREGIAPPQNIQERVVWLLSLLDDMIVSSEENGAEHQSIRESISELSRNSEDVSFSGEIPYDTICSLLESQWQESQGARGYLSRGVTFCQLTPMRSIPFRIVCLVGMNDGAIPRTGSSLAFDLIATNARLGDRLVRDDDRYLFLEAILSARDALLMSYVGQSSKNNTEISPSVLVGELLDVVGESFTMTHGSVRDHVVTAHPLQPFSPSYYSQSSSLFSYSKAYYEGAKSLHSPTDLEPSRFLSAPLVRNAGNVRELSLREFVSYFQRPTQSLLETQLGITLKDDEAGAKDREPIEMEGLDTWKVADDVLQSLVRNPGEFSAADLYDNMRASGRIPLGTVGSCWYELLQETVDALVKRAALHMASGDRENLQVDVDIGELRIHGTVDSLWTDGRLHLSYSTLGKVAEVGEWIRHLFINLCRPNNVSPETILLGRKDAGIGVDVASFRPVEQPASILEQLSQLYVTGQRLALPLFPVASRKFVEGLKSESGDVSLPDFGIPSFAKALHSARVSYRGGMFPGESSDPYVQKVFSDEACLERGYQPFDLPVNEYRDFADCSWLLFSSMLAHRQEERG